MQGYSDGRVPVLHRRVREAGEDELRAWRAGCLERGLSGSEGGGWKRAQKSNALAAYLIDEGEQVLLSIKR